MPFTYAGPSVSAAFTAGVFNEQWALAQTKADQTKVATDTALAQAANPSQMATVGLTYTPVIPVVPVLTAFDANSVDARYKAYFSEISNFLTDQFTGFIATFYPTSAYLTYAQAWIERALTTGGTGLNVNVEKQLWERDRARVLRDSGRSKDELFSTWAARGYPLPPGALVNGLDRIDQDGRDKIAQASRDMAIEQFKTEVENVRIAVTQALALRQQALNAAQEFIRAMALGPQIGQQVATAEIGRAHV